MHVGKLVSHIRMKLFQFTQGLANKTCLRKKKTPTITSEMLDNKSASIHHHYTAIAI